MRQQLLDVLHLLDTLPAPRGGERTAAHRLRAWCAERWPHVEWQVLEYGSAGGSLVAAHGAGPLLYSHLDTSLDEGGAANRLVTGDDAPVGPLTVDGDMVIGFGLGVARGPAAAALVAFAEAGAGRLLLAGSGTHRRTSGITGLEAYTDAYPLPPSAIVAKCGPPTLLWHEPGAFYLTVRVTGRSGAAMVAESATPPGESSLRPASSWTNWHAGVRPTWPPIPGWGRPAGRAESERSVGMAGQAGPAAGPTAGRSVRRRR